MKIMVHKDGQQYGPFTGEEIKSYIENGTFNQEADYGWHDGMSEWLPLKEIISQLSPSSLPQSASRPDTVSPPVVDPVAQKEESAPARFWITFILCLVLGILGVHRLWLGKKSGFVMLVTLGGCGLWWLIDIVLLLSNQLKDRKNRRVINPIPIVTWPIAAVWLLFVFSNGHSKAEKASTASVTNSSPSSTSPVAPSSIPTPPIQPSSPKKPAPTVASLAGFYLATNQNNEEVTLQLNKDQTYWLNNKTKQDNIRGQWRISTGGSLVELVGADGTVLMNPSISDDDPPKLVFGSVLTFIKSSQPVENTSNKPSDDEIMRDGAKFVNDRIESTVGPVSHIHLLWEHPADGDYSYTVEAHNTTRDLDTTIVVTIHGAENNWKVTEVHSSIGGDSN